MTSRRLTDLFLELARIDALPGKEGPVAKYALSFFKNLGLPAGLDGSAVAALSNTSNVVCQVGGGGDFVLVSHMDTLLPASGAGPLIAADRISSGGKGPIGVDSRAGMAAILYALERAVHSGLRLKPFTIAFTTRGKGNMAGVKNLALPGRIRSAFIFGSEPPPGAYTASSAGIALFSADILGRSADASLDPESGVSAIAIAAKALSALSFGRHDPETTSNVGTIAGGVNPGTVPLAALVRGQIRVSEAAKALPLLDRIKAEFEKSAQAAGGAVAFKWSWEFQPYLHAPDSEVLNLAEGALRRAGLSPAPVAAAEGSEANALNARGVAAVTFGIGACSSKPNQEYILLDHLSKAAEIVSQIIGK